MSNNRSDFVGPILLAILAYLASMLTRAFQRSIEHSAVIRSMNREENLNHTVVDDFIKDEVVLKQLQDPKVWEACDKDNLRWWDGKSKPKNIWEQLAKQIWEDRDEFQTAAGFEYWCNIIQDQKNLPWHIDKDEAEFAKNDKLITPLMGAVYYGFDHHFDKGTGMLHLVDADVNDNPLDFEYERRSEVLEISPEFNRMIMFNASKWHRVTGVTNGARYTFAVNADRLKPRTLTKY